MWGSSIIGFGNLRYKSKKTDREVDWFKIGFSPRKANFSIYLICDITAHAYEKSVASIKQVPLPYINKLDNVDLKILEEHDQHNAKNKCLRHSHVC
jgi:hypothetical protein